MGGLITGEGCFCLTVNRLRQARGAGWLRITPVFSMTMTDLETMRGVIESFRAHGLPVYVSDVTSTSKSGQQRPALRIHLNGQSRLLRLTEAFVPHLHGSKLVAANAVHDFCVHRLSRHTRGIDDVDIACVEKIRAANANNGWRGHTISDLRDYKLGRAKARKR
jgi:hypothetical protein